MSSQITPFIKTKRLSAAIAMAVIGSSTSAYAMNFGQTNIRSAQYEPLSATISVSNIDESDFDVSLANSAIYQQMGLTPNSNITATFQRTSPTAGKIVLRSSQPINEPFADLVLDIKNSDKKQFMPKTLLMPMGKSAAVNLKPQTVVATASKPELPKVTQTPEVVEAKAKATVTEAKNVTPKTVGNNQGIPDGEFASATRQAFLADQKKAPINAKNANKSEKIEAKTKQERIQTTDLPKPPKQTPAQPKPQKRQEPVSVKNTAKISTKNNLPPVTVKSNEPKIGQVNSDIILLKEMKDKNLLAKDKKPNAPKKVTKPKVKQRSQQQAKKQTNQQATSKKSSGKGTYVVQRNDNLWSIALEISKRNKTNVHTVMKQIQQNNPQAFVDGHADQLLANKTLVLPDYQVIPSQKSMQAAVKSKKLAKKSSKFSTSSKSKKKIRKKPRTKPKAKNTTKYKAKVKPKVHKKPTTNKPKVSLVAPITTKNSTQKSANNSANNKQLVVALKKKRQVAAKHASSVHQLNSKVSSYTQKLKLQNKKLAELEARLKKLKGK